MIKEQVNEMCINYYILSDIVGNISDVTNVETSVGKIVRNDEKEDIGYFEKPVINQQYTGNVLKSPSVTNHVYR